MFNLEKTIVDWKRTFRKLKDFDDGHIAELESHLRDLIQSHVNEGMDLQQAFYTAEKEIGDSKSIASEISSNARAQTHVLIKPDGQFNMNIFANYWLTFTRSSRKASLYLAISIIGLAIGYASTLLIVRYTSYELSFDTYHQNHERIFRIVNKGNTRVGSPWGPELAKQFPEIKSFVRIINFQEVPNYEARALIEYGSKKFEELKFAYVDSNVFSVFSWPLIEGNENQVLQKPFTVVLSESTALKYFGEEKPIGKIIKVYNMYDFEVTGVFKDIPENSHLKFDFLAPYETLEIINRQRLRVDLNWQDANVWTYILVNEPESALPLLKKLPEFFHSNIGSDFNLSGLGLQPLSTIHLSKKDSADNFVVDYTFIIALAFVALFILASSVISFVNLFSVYSHRRIKEVGMRKTFGASKGQLIRQFLSEAVLLSSIGATLGALLIYFMLPAFNEITFLNFTIRDVFSIKFALFLIVLNFLTGMLAGGFPSVTLSNVQVSKVLRNDAVSFYKINSLQRAMVIFQFTTSVLLITCTLVILKQLEYLKTKELGFNKDKVMILPIRGANSIERNPQTFKSQLERIGNVKEVTTSQSVPGQFLRKSYYRVEGITLNDSLHCSEVLVDFDFVDFYKIKILAGRNFNNKFLSDSSGFLVNESAIKHFGWKRPEEAIDKKIERLGRHGRFEGRVIGVVSDFNFQTLHNEVAPTVFLINPYSMNYFSIRLESDDLSKTISYIKSAWDANEDHYPFVFYMMDEDLQRHYAREKSLGQLLGYTAFLAILIGCLGLFGLAAYSIRNRQKEVGIRKTLGASVTEIILMFSGHYLMLSAIACAIALPLSYFAMNKWLESFPYKTSMGIEIFLLSAFSACLLTIFSVIVQSFQAATMNPVKSIRKD